MDLSVPQAGMRWRIDRYFGIRARGSTIGTEVRAGTTTFLTISYVLFVNPSILVAAGMPAEDAAVATALSVGIGTLVMGLWANFPFVLAPAVGLALYFTYGVVQGLGVSWQQALAAVFIEGLLFLAFSLGGLRTALIRAIPRNLQVAISVGIGLFIALVGMKSAGLVQAHPGSFVTLGNLREPTTLLALFGLFGIAALSALRVRGALLIGIAGIAGFAWVAGLAPPPEQVFALPSFPKETFLAFRWEDILTPAMISVILAFLFVDIFDTAGALLAVGRLGGFLDEMGEFPGAHKAFASDAVATVVGASLGTAAFVTTVESAAGVEEGGRTGLTAVVAACLFFLSVFVAPIFGSIPLYATAPVIILVGALMASGAAGLEWKQPDEAIPAFLTMIGMPFTFSIANGIALGLGSYVVIKVLSGKWREVSPFLFGVVALLGAFYAFIG